MTSLKFSSTNIDGWYCWTIYKTIAKAFGVDANNPQYSRTSFPVNVGHKSSLQSTIQNGMSHSIRLSHLVSALVLTAHSVCEKNSGVHTQSWLYIAKKPSGSDRAINNSSQSTRFFRSTDGWTVWLAVELKDQHPFTRMAEYTFNAKLLHTCVATAPQCDKRILLKTMIGMLCKVPSILGVGMPIKQCQHSRLQGHLNNEKST